MKATSPIKKNTVTKLAPDMTFPQAVQEIIDGKRVSKREWADPESYGFTNDNGEGTVVLSLRKDGTNHQWVLNWGDLTGTDYFVVE